MRGLAPKHVLGPFKTGLFFTPGGDCTNRKKGGFSISLATFDLVRSVLAECVAKPGLPKSLTINPAHSDVSRRSIVRNIMSKAHFWKNHHQSNQKSHNESFHFPNPKTPVPPRTLPTGMIRNSAGNYPNGLRVIGSLFASRANVPLRSVGTGDATRKDAFRAAHMRA